MEPDISEAIHVVELLDAGYDVVVLDNLSNSSEKSLDRVKALQAKK